MITKKHIAALFFCLPLTGCEVLSDPVILAGLAAGLQNVDFSENETTAFTSPTPVYIPPPAFSRPTPQASRPAPQSRTNSSNYKVEKNPKDQVKSKTSLPTALAVTEQFVDNGRWRGVGPTQSVSTWYKTEKEALNLIVPRGEVGRARLLHDVTRTVQKRSTQKNRTVRYRIYLLDRPLRPGDKDARKWPGYADKDLPFPTQ